MNPSSTPAPWCPSVPRSGWVLSHGGSCAEVQISSASRQMTVPSVTWCGGLLITPEAGFEVFQEVGSEQDWKRKVCPVGV